MISRTKAMIKRYTLAALLFSATLGAQTNVEFEKDNFPGKKDEYKEAKKNVEAGDDFFNVGMGFTLEAFQAFAKENGYYPAGLNETRTFEAIDQFSRCIDPYLKANAFNPNNALLNYRIGVAYYFQPEKKLKALTYLEQALKLKPGVDPDIHYYLGRLYHLNMQWDKAMGEYKTHQSMLRTNPKDNKERISDMDKKVNECINGKEFMKTPQRVFIDNVGNGINTKFPEYGPIITADESMMFFTSVRDNCTGGLQEGIYFEDVFMSLYKNGSWQPAVNIGSKINSKNHDATGGLSPDGQTLFIYRGDNGGDLYESSLFGIEWSEPEKMNKNINTERHEPSCGLSYDGANFYFVSSRKEGSFGTHDIWMSTKDPKGKWGTGVNIGNTVNTMYNEDAIFVHPDGKTFYFSSQGHKSMGGYDIFKCTFENGKWSTPENLGYPINGPDDDVFFVISGSGRHGYFASAKSGGDYGQSYGEKDIYKITFLGPEKPLALNTEDNLIASLAAPVKNAAAPPVEIKTSSVTILKGTITDAITQKPLAAQIELVDNELRQVIATFTSNSSTGKYLVTLPSGKNYGIAVKADGYLFHSENFDIPATAAYQEVVKDVQLKNVQVGAVIVLRNIFFDYNKSTLRPESQVELDRLIKLLTDIPTMKIEISGHTDKRGDDDYNLRLSQNRSQSVVDYLTQKGIAPSRLTAVGYGETKLITQGVTEEDHQQNRRTEFKILSK